MQPADSDAHKPGITHFAKAAIQPVFAAIAVHDRLVLTRQIYESRRRLIAQYRAFRRSLPKPAIQQLSLFGASNEPRTRSDAPAPPVYGQMKSVIRRYKRDPTIRAPLALLRRLNLRRQL
jgi:hypothetical protein